MAAAVLMLVAAAALRWGLVERRRVVAVRRAHGRHAASARGHAAAPAARPAPAAGHAGAPGSAADRRGRVAGTPMGLVLSPPRWLPARLADAGVAVAPSSAWRAWLAAITTAAGWAFLGAGAGAGVLAAAVAVAGPCLAWRLLRHRGASRVEAALPAAVEAVAASLRSGASLRQAVGEAAAATPGLLGTDLAQVAIATERGGGLIGALEAWADRRPLPGVRLAVAALCLCAETGGAAAQAVDSVAATLRQRLAAQAEARALATQARMSAAVIAVAPVAFCALSAAADPRSSAFLLRTRLGLALLAAGLALDAAGAVWMARLTRLEP